MKFRNRRKTERMGSFSLPKLCIGIFLACFLIGVLAANISLTDEAIWIGYLNEDRLIRFSPPAGGVLFFSLRYRMPVWLLIVVCGVFPWGRLLCGAWSGWVGISGGFLFTALIGRFGFKGILVMCGLCLPQMFFYTSAVILQLYLIRYYLLGKRRIGRERPPVSKRGKLLAAYLLLSFAFTGVWLAGILAEYYINPLLLVHLKQ